MFSRSRFAAGELLTDYNLQPGKVVIVLQGRQAGKKAVIVKSHDEASGSRRYGHALICGLSKEPRKVCVLLLLVRGVLLMFRAIFLFPHQEHGLAYGRWDLYR